MRILIAEDTRLTRLKLRNDLEKMGHEVVEAADGEEAWEAFQAVPFPIVVTDWEMPKMNGVELVQRIRDAAEENYVYIVMLTGRTDKKDVVTGMQAGADDFIVKPFDSEELAVRVGAGVRIVELEQHLADANVRLRHELAVAKELSDAENRRHAETLLGQSIPVRALREGIKSYADGGQPLLLTGPPGAGQQAVARAVHCQSSRCERPFIYVACPYLMNANESLFGARTVSDGESSLCKASLADGGTLYLEGIESLDKQAQQDLIEFLQRAEKDRHADQRPCPDIRLIAYLNESRERLFDIEPELEQLVGQQRLAVPSLAERRDDIRDMAVSILDQRAHSVGKVLDGFTDTALEMLQGYSWPGNVRELRSVVERAVLLATGSRVDIPAELLREGRRIGGYTLQRRLGKGGMGEVWLAQHSLLARPSAVKLIGSQSVGGDTNAREQLQARFQREAQATARLRSPNTVELYDFGITEDGDFYYVMEYLQGVDLRFLVNEFGALPPPRAVHILTQACMSLAEAHRRGLVHRDIKPANLFVCQLGTHYDFLKLLDFGIVRATGGDQTTGSAELIRGTPECISPEAASGEQATFASDIYGLGCVAYWLLTGQRVFNATSVMALLMQHVTKQPVSLREHDPSLPDDLDQLVLNCLAKNPADRPSSAQQLAELLAELRLDETWDNSRARAWWEENYEQISAAGSFTDTGETLPSLSSATTSSETDEHPADADLKAWLSGALSINKGRKIERHLETCDSCAVRLGQLDKADEEDGFLNRVREVMDRTEGIQGADTQSNQSLDEFDTNCD